MAYEDNKNTRLNEASFKSYNENPKDRCWYDSCDCEDIPIADCDRLVEENNKGVGRFACMAESQKCYNPKFFSSFIKKLHTHPYTVPYPTKHRYSQCSG